MLEGGSGIGEAVVCWHLEVSGMIQGLGFRPFIYRLAQEWGLSGWVLNSSRGGSIEIQGMLCAVEGFYNNLLKKKPPLVRINSLIKSIVTPGDYHDF